MHILLASLLALTSLQLVNADGSARVTQAPAIPKIFRRQDYICPTGDYTTCADGFGCCERGAPCTTIRGEAACDTGECNGIPCGNAGLCCDAVCTSSRGTAICVHDGGGLGTGSGNTMTYPGYPTITTAFSNSDLTTSVPGPTKPDSDGEDESTTSTLDETSGGRSTTPTPAATSSSGDDGGGSDTMTRPTVTQTVSPNGEPFPTSSSGDTGGGSGGDSGDGGGAGMVSPRGGFVVLGLVLVSGLFLVR